MSRGSLAGAVIIVVAALSHPALAAADEYTWTGQGDHRSFDDAANWSPHGVPDSDDDATVKRLPGGPGTLVVGKDAHLGRLTQLEGSYVIGGNLTLSKRYDWSRGELDAGDARQLRSRRRASGSHLRALGHRHDRLHRRAEHRRA